MKEKNDLIWGVIHTGPLTFIGAFCDYPYNDAAPRGLVEHEGEVIHPQETAIKKIENDIVLGKVIRIEPAMELAAPWQQVRRQTPAGEQVGMSRSALPSPYGFTTGKTKLRLFNIQAVAFIDEMTKEDQRLYRAYIETIFQTALAESAARAGIELVHALPEGAHRAR